MAKTFTYEEFVKAWHAAGGIQELCEKFECHRNTIETMASRLRKAGVQLKKFRVRNERGLPDVAALNQLIATLGPPGEEGDDEEQPEQATA